MWESRKLTRISNNVVPQKEQKEEEKNQLGTVVEAYCLQGHPTRVKYVDFLLYTIPKRRTISNPYVDDQGTPDSIILGICMGL